MGIIWKEEYSTGVEKLDEQHKVLFRNLNKFENIIRNKGGADAAKKMLSFLESYAHKHFSFEEQYMDQHACPVSEQNKEAHRRFFMMFDRWKQRVEEEGADEMLLDQIHSSVETWISNHVLGIDIQLRTSIESSDEHEKK